MKKTNQNPVGGGIKSLKPHRAFTLAEVLITLAIIGIVAALTIPTLVSKNQNKQLYTQFMKAYNTISNALNLAMMDYGNPINWKTSKQGNSDYIKIYLIPYLKNVSVCEKPTDCFGATYKYLDGTSAADIINAVFGAKPFTIQLPDGVAILQLPGDDNLIIDTNGQKGPNVFGRDLFVPALTNEGLDDRKREMCNGMPLCLDGDSDTCISLNAQNEDCVSKLIIEGAMNY